MPAHETLQVYNFYLIVSLTLHFTADHSYNNLDFFNLIGFI